MPFLTHFIGITSSIRAQYGIDLPGLVLVTFHGGSFLVGFLKKEILGFDENLEVVLLSDLQQCVRLQLPPKRLCANGTRKR